MKQGDILGFHAWNTRVFCVFCVSLSASLVVSMRSAFIRPLSPAAVIPDLERAQFYPFSANKMMHFRDLFMGGNENMYWSVLPPTRLDGIGGSVVLE